NSSPLQSSSVQDNQVALNFSDLMENLSYVLENYSYSVILDYTDVEPCRNYYCPLFQRVAPAFLAATCVLAALGNGALLATLAKQWHSWGGPVGKTAAAQLAAAALLFALPLPALAWGIAWGWHLGPWLCRAA
ncbi:ACKR1 protein, partial [Crypturellus undulatus]|nr:ACKR1 protein [Crypturellus undulatus]